MHANLSTRASHDFNRRADLNDWIYILSLMRVIVFLERTVAHQIVNLLVEGFKLRDIELVAHSSEL